MSMRICLWYRKWTYVKKRKKSIEKEVRQQFDLGPNGVRGNDKHLLQRGMSSVLSSTIREQK